MQKEQNVCPKCSKPIKSVDRLSAHLLVCFSSQQEQLNEEIQIIKQLNNLKGQGWRNEKKYWKRCWKNMAKEILQRLEEQQQDFYIEINEEEPIQQEHQFTEQELQEQQRLKCPWCSRVFASKYNVQRHFAKIHFGLKDYGKKNKKRR